MFSSRIWASASRTAFSIAVAAATPTTALPSPAPEPSVAKPTLELALPDDEPAPDPQPVADQAAGEKAGTEAVARRVSPKKAEAPAEKGKTLTAAQRDMLARMGGGEGTSNLAAIKGSSASSSDTSGGAGGEGLDAQQLASVVNKGKRSLQRCYEVALRGSGSTETVRLDVEITVAPSGIVSSVKAKGQSLPGMDQCIHNTVRTWVFPKSGSATTTQFPILFQPGA